MLNKIPTLLVGLVAILMAACSDDLNTGIYTYIGSDDNKSRYSDQPAVLLQGTTRIAYVHGLVDNHEACLQLAIILSGDTSPRKFTCEYIDGEPKAYTIDETEKMLEDMLAFEWADRAIAESVFEEDRKQVLFARIFRREFRKALKDTRSSEDPGEMARRIASQKAGIPYTPLKKTAPQKQQPKKPSLQTTPSKKSDEVSLVRVSYNPNGAVFTTNTDYKLYLGKSCDAMFKPYGSGRWVQHNAEISISFSNGKTLWLAGELALDHRCLP